MKNLNEAQSITLTLRGADKILQLINEEEEESLRLRIFVQGGGCSGFVYGFTFDSQISADDVVVEQLKVPIVIDCISYQYLAGCEIDYQNDIQGAKFVVKNPNAATTCGCGSSFTIK